MPVGTNTVFGHGGRGMDELTGFVLEEGRGVYRPVGAVSFNEAVALVRAAIAATRAATQIRGPPGRYDDADRVLPSPDTLQRFLAAVQWADEAGGTVCLALVAREEMIDPEKFGVMVATNRGLVCNIFTTEAEARAWLDAQRRRGP